ncbi:ThiF family adenylyltransferase [soil metagenome]
MYIRIKSYLRIQKIGKKLHFLLSPYKGIKIMHDDLLEQILKKINSVGQKDSILQELESELGLNKKITSLLINRMIDMHILEYFNPNEDAGKFERYDRQLNFFDLTLQVKSREDLFLFQEKLSKSHVVILGVGGIGNYASIALAGAGIGELTLFDGDIIEYSNLNRQILFDEIDVGEVKIDIAEKRLKKFNSNLKINKIQKHCSNESDLQKELLNLGRIDFILVSADKPRSMANWVDNFCSENKVPFIPCGYFGNYGIVGPLISPETLTYAEKYPETLSIPKTNILDEIIYSPPSMACTNGIVSNIAVLEIIKYLTGFDKSALLSKRLLLNFSEYNFNIE